MEIEWWPRDDSVEWLQPLDGLLAVSFVRYIVSSGRETLPKVLEIGVWKGGWASVILKNTQNASVVGVDPFPKLENVRHQLLNSIEANGIANRFSLHASTDEVHEEVRFDLVHIDGAHSEEQTSVDLYFARDRLKHHGIIIVDDYRNLWFPGVASALFGFLKNEDFECFAVSGAKAYLAGRIFADEYRKFVASMADESKNFLAWTSWQEKNQGSKLMYNQSSMVSGSPVLILEAGPGSTALRRILGQILPPMITNLLRNLRSFFKTLRR